MWWAQVTTTPRAGGLTWWWLSYASEDGFRGICIVEGEDLIGAARRARELGISPGGQVLGAAIPESEVVTIPESHRNRLLTRDEAIALDSTAKSLAEHAEEEG